MHSGQKIENKNTHFSFSMVNPGSFKGARKAFLLSQKLEYALAVKEHRSTEALSLILRAFFRRFPIHLSNDYEPSEDELALIDDTAPDPELPDIGSAEESDTSADDASQPQPKKKKKKKAKQSSKSRKNRIAFRCEVCYSTCYIICSHVIRKTFLFHCLSRSPFSFPCLSRLPQMILHSNFIHILSLSANQVLDVLPVCKGQF